MGERAHRLSDNEFVHGVSGDGEVQVVERLGGRHLFAGQPSITSLVSRDVQRSGTAAVTDFGHEQRKSSFREGRAGIRSERSGFYQSAGCVPKISGPFEQMRSRGSLLGGIRGRMLADDLRADRVKASQMCAAMSQIANTPSVICDVRDLREQKINSSSQMSRDLLNGAS